MNHELSRREKIRAFLLGTISGLAGLALLAGLIFQIPAVKDRYGWRLDFAEAYLRGVVDPVKPLPPPQGTESAQDVLLPLPSDTPLPAPTEPPGPTVAATATVGPTLTPTAIPGRVELPAPEWEKQDVNNCGPATLALYLRTYGWKGDQTTIASEVRPNKEDRNVNVEELVGYVNTKVPGLEVQYRVGGDVTTLKHLLAAGFPVMIEETFMMDESYWPNDDRWAGHYLLVTGYDDANSQFTGQDVFVGPNITISYDVLNDHWKAFNRVYILVYPPDSRPAIQSILGEQWDVQANRQHALEAAQKEAEANPKDGFAWFNQGTNLVFFERYAQAAAAYDKAREAGLPQRMLRYQFGPFFAYFNVNRLDDVLELSEYALKRSPTSEEAMLWRGWAMYRKGDKEEAVKLFQKALDAQPGYADAKYALGFMRDH
jgi:hypothetical protein